MGRLHARLAGGARRGATYSFLPDGDGNVTEGGGYNIFAVKDRVLFTPVRGVLEGVTRKTVLELATAKGLKAVVDYVPVDLLYQADEIFMSTTAGGVMPITQLTASRWAAARSAPSPATSGKPTGRPTTTRNTASPSTTRWPTPRPEGPRPTSRRS
ncbi:MAG: aminotransferase class IV [Caulobacteraceae bacterium]